MATIAPADIYSLKLHEFRRTLLGIFDTKLRCNCGKANIADHATQGRVQESRVLGPGPSHYQRLQQFYVVHAYRCDTCGAQYASDVIEGARGYLPRDRKNKH